MSLASLEGPSEYDRLVASCIAAAFATKKYPGYVYIDRTPTSRLPHSTYLIQEGQPSSKVWVGTSPPPTYERLSLWLNTNMGSDSFNIFMVNFENPPMAAVWFPVQDSHFVINPRSLGSNPATAVSTPFVGASAASNGVAGLVTQPLAGDQEKFLRGDGTWAPKTGSAIRWDPPPFPSGETLFTLPSLPDVNYPVSMIVNGQTMEEDSGFTRTGVNVVWSNNYPLEATDSVQFHFVPS